LTTLNSLQQAQLTFKLYGYQYGPAKRYIKAAKTYFVDNGIIHSFNARVTEGQQLENFEKALRPKHKCRVTASAKNGDAGKKLS